MEVFYFKEVFEDYFHLNDSFRNISKKVLVPVVFFLLSKLLVDTIRKCYPKNNSALNFLPGPPSLPVLGNLMQIPPSSNQFHGYLDLVNKYGPIFRFSIFNYSFVLITSASMALPLLKSNKLGHTFKPLLPYGPTGIYVKDGVLTKNGPKWRTSRKLLSTTMSTKAVLKYVKYVNNHCNMLVNDLQKLFSDGQTHTEVHDMVGAHIVAITCEMITGVPITNMDECTEHHHQFKKLGIVPFIPIHKPRLLFFYPIKVIQNHIERTKALKHLNSFIDRRVNEIHEKRLNSKMKEGIMERGMLDVLVDNNIRNEGLIYEAKTLLVAGYDTVALSMDFVLWMMALHPDHQKLCRQEVDDVCELMENTKGPFSIEHISKLKYLEMCILEALRMYPVAFSPSRYLDEPLKINYNGEEKELPRGTIITLSILGIHRNPADYPDPDKFDPGRFSPERIAQHGAPPFLTFSSGIRGCMGKTFAMIEMKMIVAYLLRHFEWTTEDKISDVEIFFAFNLVLERNINYKFVPRVNTLNDRNVIQ